MGTMQGEAYAKAAAGALAARAPGIQKKLREVANKRLRNVENIVGPIHLEAEKLLEMMPILESGRNPKREVPMDVLKKVEGMLTPLTLPAGKGNTYINMSGTGVKGMLVNDHLAYLDRYIGPPPLLEDQQVGYLKSVAALLETVRDHQIPLSADGMMMAPRNAPSIEGQLARGALITSQSPQAIAFRRFGKVGVLALGTSLVTFGVGISAMNFVQSEGLDWNWAQVFGGGILYALVQGFNLPGAAQARTIAEPGIQGILSERGIRGDAGAELFDKLTSVPKNREHMEAYLDSGENDKEARVAFLKAMGNNKLLAKMPPAELRLFIQTCYGITDESSKTLARGVILGQ